MVGGDGTGKELGTMLDLYGRRVCCNLLHRLRLYTGRLMRLKEEHFIGRMLTSVHSPFCCRLLHLRPFCYNYR